ncbi:Hypothetical protein NTJ_06073 [Nesidiocoris tenuis]|uniref:Uncharacterized protein n=1 Tax=Nesidiocoris tenuis TaxID=355587 RepID=A0ABN7ALZ9_9HEMI|nr:Hypothetical protein NTJ_06073 [Nesidiocoris tenuis]
MANFVNLDGQIPAVSSRKVFGSFISKGNPKVRRFTWTLIRCQVMLGPNNHADKIACPFSTLQTAAEAFLSWIGAAGHCQELPTVGEIGGFTVFRVIGGRSS